MTSLRTQAQTSVSLVMGSRERSPYAIRPIRAIAALWRLIKNPDDTVQGARLVEAIEGRAPVRMLARARTTSAGQALLNKRPDLLRLLKDSEWLSSLPEGTLGRGYYEFCQRERIEPGGLADAVRDGLSRERAAKLSADETFLADWQRESHDLVHVLAGYGTDILGETLVLALTAQQTRNQAFWSLVAAGGLCLLVRGKPGVRRIRHALRRGKRAVHIPTLDWTELLERPLSEVRERTRLGSSEPHSSTPRSPKPRSPKLDSRKLRMGRRGRAWVALAALLITAAPLGKANADAAVTHARAVSALGRIEPRDGVYQVAGPSRVSAVIAELAVEEGDQVEQGGIVAVLDDRALHRAEVQRIRAELENAERELVRAKKLSRSGVATDVRYDAANLAVKVARADLARAEAELAMSVVRSPVSGQVLKIHARGGERVGALGIVELGRTDQMVAIAEVYETDVGLVKAGQRARVSSPALPRVLEGEVERVGLKVGRLDLFATDPAARTDARVVEVLIRLDDGAVVSGLTNLQVKIAIEP